MQTSRKLLIMSWLLILATLSVMPASFATTPLVKSERVDPARIMVIYNTVRMDSVDPAEADSFSYDMAKWYMIRYGMPTTHLFGYDMGTKVRWNNPGAFDFLVEVANYITANDIQMVLLAPGTPLVVRDTNNLHDLALDSLAGHALWFARVKIEAPATTLRTSVAPTDSNLYFPYMDMGDGASPFVERTNDATRWCAFGGNLKPYGRQWYEPLPVDLSNHPSVRPYGRIGLPYYLEAFPDADLATSPELAIPLENSQFVKDLVNGGIAATTSIAEFNALSSRSLLFFGREGNTASFIDVDSGITEAMAQDALKQGVSETNLVRIRSSGGWNSSTCLQEPAWDYNAGQFMDGLIATKINPLIFSAGGVNNTKENVRPWPASLDVQPGLLASVSVSNGRTFAGSLLKRGATTVVVNIKHPQNSRLHAWFSVFRQLVAGVNTAEAVLSAGGGERGGYITGSIWGDPLYAPFGHNPRPLDLDEDKDGLYRIAETRFGTDPTLADTDNDGLTDFQEVCYDGDCNNYTPAPTGGDLDARNPDTDGDGMADGWEIDNQTNPLVNDAVLDPDKDGLNNLEEYTAGTKANREDTDGDGLLDGVEVKQYGSNPLSRDTDSDGMLDGWEVANGLNLLDPADALLDTDNDGIDNLTEFQLGTDPNVEDSDLDGLSDGDEVNVYNTNPKRPDTDQDGINDGEEVASGTDPLSYADSDLDGMSDDWETLRGTWKRRDDARRDMDGDGVDNVIEYLRGTLPADAASRPVIQTIHVDAVNGDDATGDGSLSSPFASLRSGIAAARAGDTVVLAPGSYGGNSFLGLNKSVLLRGPENRSARLASAFVYINGLRWGGLSNLSWSVSGYAYYVNSRNVEFRNTEISLSQTLNMNRDTKLFMDHVLLTGTAATAIVASDPAVGSGSRTELRLNNVTLSGFSMGIDWNQGYGLRITNSILANTVDLKDTWPFQVWSSLVSDGQASSGFSNLGGDPRFVDAAKGDYHLLADSPAIDTASPFVSAGAEPAPNGYRLNMGFYGGTVQAASASDSDADGLPDGWETAVGLDPLNRQDRTGDADGDGLNNTLEYRQASNPNNANSRRGLSFHLLNPNQLGGSLTAVSLVDNSYLYGLGSYARLAQYQLQTLSTVDAPAGARIYTREAISLGNNADGTDMPVASWFAGHEFVIPHYRFVHRYYLYSPYGAARVSVQTDTLQTLTVPRGKVVVVEAGSNNTLSGRVRSDMPLLVSHAAVRAGNLVDTYGVAPAARQLVGVPSRGFVVGALLDNTQVTLTDDKGVVTRIMLNAGGRYASSLDNTLSQGQGAVQVVADKPVAAMQVADSDGIEATAFWDPIYFGRRYALPLDSQYVAVVCLQASDISLHDLSGAVVDTRSCTPAGSGQPGRARFGKTANGTAMSAGQYLIGTQPFYVIYEASTTNDEKNLLGHLN